MIKTAVERNDIKGEEIKTTSDHSLFLNGTEAGNLSAEVKVERIRYHFGCIMKTMGLDLEDENLKDTPARVARMYVEEIFSGLNPENYPALSTFDNTYEYEEMLIEKDITFYSCCEHYFVPIIGSAHVAYIPDKKVIGLSKINRLVQYYARRPQVLERLTVDIANGLKQALQIEDIAVHIRAEHLCVSSRGVQDTNSATCTSHFGGKFQNAENKRQFLARLNL